MLLQPKKASSPIYSILSPKELHLTFGQFLKASLSIFLITLKLSLEDKLTQSVKAPISIFFVLDTSIPLTREVQPSKAQQPIFCKLLVGDIFFRYLQFLKASLSISFSFERPVNSFKA